MKFYSLLLFALLLAGCATPSEKFSSYAQDLGMLTQSIRSQQFEHRVFVKKSAKVDIFSDELHVYIDGDGTPWIRHYGISDDPTSRNPLILDLIQKDQAPAILLGWPCYHQLNPESGCASKYWTSHRYSADVVDSMAKALNAWLQKYENKKVILIGFSGGGTLAVLMARYVPKVSAIITIAANLDVTAWSRHHGSQLLDQSLNPAEMPPASKIRQIHLVGTDDVVVPPETITKFIEKNKNALIIPYSGFQHHCCWADQWQDILRKILK